MKRLDPFLPVCRKMLLEGANIEQVLQFLRGSGIDKVRSTIAMELLEIAPLREAKILVHESETWADVRERDAKFHDELFDAANELRAKEDEGD